MAIRLQFINLVIPIATLDRVLAPEGGFERILRPLAGDMLWFDEYLCRVDGAMNWGDVDSMVERWEAHDLQGLVGAEPHQWWKDFAICASRRGPTFPCDWLVYDAVDNCVYLAGTEKGAVNGPSPLA
ncbi:MAG: hypothetical protein ACM3ZT_10800 [Bacillota bacterium]